MAKVSVIGTTSWGTTLAMMLARKGAEVRLWARTQEETLALDSARENQRLLPGFPFPPGIHVTSSVVEATTGADVIILVVPSRSLRENVRGLLPHLDSRSIILSATKGLENESAKRMSEVMEEELSEAFHSRISVLSGPNLAKEIAQGLPASTVVASQDEEVAMRVQELFMSSTFRVYTNTDVVGVELGGALKNIIAIGAGISDGLGYGNNGKAAFITRGLVEITRLGVSAGANPLTFAGLAGLGDLVTTCYSPLSRNRYLGEQLAAGRSLEGILSSMSNIAEGVDTTLGALKLASDLNVDMPLTQAISTVLFQGMDPRQAVIGLMDRAPRPEWSGIQL
ncbi:NAD(P)-dependent glycerol-3-phosphate dehydrogenase [SAR202 cluster bacterium AC-647-N09_OGT_505m]|nr:NAD(P)-dependent glycerol-3-phosphate dehydrogenase [SAR202 cluster bacterium AC-647-N09_OGT_505m]